MKRLITIILCSTFLLTGCLSTKSFDDNEQIGTDFTPREFFINLRLVSYDKTYRIYTDTLTGIMYYSVLQDNKWSSPVQIIDEDGNYLTYNKCVEGR